MSSSQPARKRLPANPSEENLKKQAKGKSKADKCALAKAQHQLAQDYGFASWPKLIQHVRSMRDIPDDWNNDADDNPIKAANDGDAKRVGELLKDKKYSQHALDLALGRSCCSMRGTREAEYRATAELLYKNGADPNGEYGNGYGPILLASCEFTNPIGMRFLLERGADPTKGDSETDKGRAMAMLLGTYGRGRNALKHEGLNLLVEHGAVVPSIMPPLFLAIHRGDVAALSAFLDRDRSLISRRFPEMPYGNLPLAGATLLHCAVEYGEMECLNLLLDRNADINAKSDIIDGVGGQTPIYHAINTNSDGNFHVLEYLAKRFGKQIDMSVQATWRGQTTPLTPLEYGEKAAREFKPEWAHYRPRISDELAILRSMQAGKNVSGRTEGPADFEAFLAIYRGDAQMLAKMLETDASRLKRGFPELKNIDDALPLSGATLLHLAVAYHQRECCDELFKCYADINMTADVIDGVGGHTPIFHAARSSSATAFSMLQYLVERVGNWIDTSIKAKVRDGNRIVEKTVMEYANERERKLLEPLDRRTHIKNAILSNDTGAVSRMLDEHPELLTPDLWPNAIFRAKSLDITRLLLDRGLDPNQCSAPRRPLHLAAYQALPEIVAILIEHGADVNQLNPLGERPMDIVAGYAATEHVPPNENVRRVRDLLRGAGAKYEPAHEAAMQPHDTLVAKPLDAEAAVLKSFAEALNRQAGDVEVARKLLDAHPHLANSRPWSPQSNRTALEAMAANCVWHRSRQVEIARLLVERGATCDLPTAARCGNIVEVARQLDADPSLIDRPDAQGRTALYRATCVYGSFPEGEAVADELIRRGATIDLFSASTLGLIDRVRELLAADASLAKSIDPDGMTALHWAVRIRRRSNAENDVEIARLLIDAGADIEAPNPQEGGMHPLHHCGEWASSEAMLDLLLSRGANINARAEQNQWSPLDYAIGSDRKPMIEWMRARGGKTRE